MIDCKMQNEWEAAFCQLRSISQSFVANLHILDVFQMYIKVIICVSIDIFRHAPTTV